MVDDDSLDKFELSSAAQDRSGDWLSLQIAVLGLAFDAPFPGLMSLGGGGHGDGADVIDHRPRTTRPSGECRREST